ncbi:MAG: histidine kinase [Myxococcales bacterium]|jgi:signal transduction histidine kinase|nr:histidine kinase [Myxococcales bacterium]
MIEHIDPTEKIALGQLVDAATLTELFESFRAMLQVPLRIFDGNGDLVAESSDENPVCAHLTAHPKLRERCNVVRMRVKAAAPWQDRDPQHRVNCFSGLQYHVAPIHFQGDLVGKLVLGPFLPKALEKIPSAIHDLAPDINRTELLKAFNALPRIDDAKIERYANAVLTALDIIFFSSHRAHMTTQMHLAAVRESYRELTEKNRTLEEMAEERKEFDRRKSNFLAMVSHELRTPLTSIIGYSDMLAEGIAGEMAEEQKQFVQTIKTKGDELLGLISSILDFSQIDTGRLSITTAPVNVPDLLQRAVATREQLAERRGIRLKIDLPTGLPTVPMDPEKILVALTHLIDNAIKFSLPGGSVRIGAQVVQSAAADAPEDGFGFVLMAAPDMLEISVEDHGVGIDEKDCDDIFQPFTQIDESSTREHGGAGLGLAIVQQYVEVHGGRVHVQSSLGEGSRFVVRLPILNLPG